MARKLTPEQCLALKLLSEGVSTKEIAQRLKVSQRTIERWQKLPEFCEVFERSTQSLITQVSNDWIARSQAMVESHNATHQLAIDLALKGLKKIEEKLDDCDIEGFDVRRLNWLSMILHRHIEGQRVAMSLDFLNLNRCGQLLEKAGYVVIDPTAENNKSSQLEDEDEG